MLCSVLREVRRILGALLSLGTDNIYWTMFHSC